MPPKLLIIFGCSLAPILFSSSGDKITNCLSPVAIFFAQAEIIIIKTINSRKELEIKRVN